MAPGERAGNACHGQTGEENIKDSDVVSFKTSE